MKLQIKINKFKKKKKNWRKIIICQVFRVKILLVDAVRSLWSCIYQELKDIFEENVGPAPWAALSVIAVLISETDSGSTSFIMLSIKGIVSSVFPRLTAFLAGC